MDIVFRKSIMESKVTLTFTSRHMLQQVAVGEKIIADGILPSNMGESFKRLEDVIKKHLEKIQIEASLVPPVGSSENWFMKLVLPHDTFDRMVGFIGTVTQEFASS